MASEKVLEAKKQAVAELVEKLNSSVAGVVVEYKGVSVSDDTKLRADLRAENVEYKVVKNSLLKRAAEQANLKELEPVLEGTTAIAISHDDQVAAARIIKKFADAHEGFNIKSGYMDGAVIDLDTISSLAALPPKDVLLATVCNAFNAPIASFARVLQAVVDQKGEGAEAPAAE